MICENGKVVAIEDKIAWVETLRTGSCQSCSAKAGCGQGLLNSVFSGKRHYVRVDISDYGGKLSLYDEVELAIPENAMVLGSFWVYLLPLFFLMGGAFAGEKYFLSLPGETGVILGAALGFALACVVLKIHSGHNAGNPLYQPRINKILHSATVKAEAVVIPVNPH